MKNILNDFALKCKEEKLFSCHKAGQNAICILRENSLLSRVSYFHSIYFRENLKKLDFVKSINQLFLHTCEKL